MDSHGHSNPRAHGKRLAFSDIAEHVHIWLKNTFGSYKVTYEYGGGLSPGCAASIITSDNTPLFIKAAQENSSDATVALFRHEHHVLMSLPPASYRPKLVGAYDSNNWVALVIEHIDGSYPDFTDATTMDTVAEMITCQAAELSPFPQSLNVLSLKDATQWWVPRWEEIRNNPSQFIPEQFVDFITETNVETNQRFERTKNSLHSETVCHFDIRNDNLLIQPDGTVMFLDWGIAMTGPRWVDLLILALQAPDPKTTNMFIDKWIPDELQETVTDFLILFGGSQAWNATQPAPPRQPALPGYLADDAARLLTTAQLRVTQTS